MRLSALIPVLLLLLSACAGTPGSSEPGRGDAARGSGPPSGPAEAAVLALGRQFTALFFDGEDEQLWERLDPSLAELFGSIDSLPAFRAQVLNDLGVEVERLSERVDLSGSVRFYALIARFADYAAPIQVLWGFDGDDRASAFQIRPQPVEAPTEFLERLTRTPLRLPFDGRWDVFWGGRTVDVNYHTAYPDQRFAYDLLIIEDGSSYTGEGTANEDYHCFGVPILAPGAGTVVAAGDGVPDNVPGVMNPSQPLGNHVILDHGQGEFSVMAHFKLGTLQVAVGDVVAAGQQLGLCGNSGNSSEAHLHYHLQTTAVPFGGLGLPAQFLSYEADGVAVARGEPVKGQSIRHLPAR